MPRARRGASSRPEPQAAAAARPPGRARPARPTRTPHPAVRPRYTPNPPRTPTWPRGRPAARVPEASPGAGRGAPGRPGALAGRVRRAAALAFCASLAAPLLGAGGSAEAQEVVLVSNIGSASSTVVRLGTGSTGKDAVQLFETGNNAGGYTLTSIEFDIYRDGTAATGLPTATLHNVTVVGTSVTLGTAVATLTTSLTFVPVSSSSTYTAPTNTALEPSTTYGVVLEGGPDSTIWDLAMTGDEDATPATGWSIGDQVATRAHDATGVFTLASVGPVQIRVNGEVKTTTPTNNPPTVANAIPDQTATAGRGFSYQFPANTFNDADTGQTLSYTATQADGTALPTWLAFTAGTRTFAGTPAATDVGTVSVKVTASDGNGGSVSDTFDMVVTAAITVSYVPLANEVAEDAGTIELLVRVTSHPMTGTPRAFSLVVNTADGTATTADNDYVPVAGQILSFGVGDISKSHRIIINDDSVAESDETFTSTLSIDSGPAVFDTRTNFGATATITITNDDTTNTPPTVANAIPDQTATAGTAFSYAFPANTFNDTDTGQTLSYAATQADGTALPTWLSFTAGTRTFAGTPAASDVGTVSVKVTASDGNGGSVSDEFDITVADTTPPTLTSATVLGHGQGIFLAFSENLDFSNLPPVSAFTVTADGNTRTTRLIGRTGHRGDEVGIQFAPEILQGQTVVITYTDPTSGNDANAIQDTAGNDAATFTTGMNSVPAVINNSTLTNNPATGAPTITGTAQVGKTLTADTSAITDANGLTNVSYAYQWIRRTSAGVDSDITGATSSTYTLVLDDLGHRIRVRVSFTDDLNNDETLTSLRTALVTATTPPVFSDTTLTRSLAENTAANTNVGAVIPAATDADGDTLTYTMEGTDADSFTFDAATRRIKTKTGVTYDFEAKASYAVTIKADDGNGGTDTVAVTITLTDADEPPAAPAAPVVTATSGSTTSLDVSWSAPANSGKPAITSYDLQYRAGTSGSFTDGPQDVTGTSATVPSLTAGTAYEVQVRATNAEGDSGWSLSGSGSTNTAANNAPVFSDTTLTRSLAENTAANTNVGAAIPAATDADSSDTLTYTMEGADAASFTFDAATRQIKTKTGVTYDFEAKASYAVTIKVADGNGGADTVAVTITLTDADEPPAAPAAPVGDGDVGLDHQPGRELERAREQRQAGHHELRPAIPRGHQRQLHRRPAGRDRDLGDGPEPDGGHGLRGAGTRDQRRGRRRLVPLRLRQHQHGRQQRPGLLRHHADAQHRGEHGGEHERGRGHPRGDGRRQQRHPDLHYGRRGRGLVHLRRGHPADQDQDRRDVRLRGKGLLRGDDQGRRRQRRRRHRGGDHHAHGRGRTAGGARGAGGDGDVGLDHQPGRELERAREQRQAGHHELRPAIPRGHQRQLHRRPAGRDRDLGDGPEPDGGHGLRGAGTRDQRRGRRRLVPLRLRQHQPKFRHQHRHHASDGDDLRRAGDEHGGVHGDVHLQRGGVGIRRGRHHGRQRDGVEFH